MRGFHKAFWAILLTVISSCGAPESNPVQEPLRIEQESVNDSLKEINLSIKLTSIRDLFSITKETFERDAIRLYKDKQEAFDLFTSR